MQRTLPKKLQKSPLRKINILVEKRFFAIFSPFTGRFFQKYPSDMQPRIVHPGLKSVWRISQNKILQRNLNGNFGAKIQIFVFPVSGFQSSPNFTSRRSLGTCTRRRNPRSIISNRSKVIQEKRFPEFCENRIFAFGRA
jgi:hypothetical protein